MRLRPRPNPFTAVPDEIAIGEMGALLITPGMTQSEMDATDTAIVSLVRDVGDSPKADDRFRQEFGQFARDWITFKDRNKGWWERGLSGVFEQVQDFKRRLNQWRDRFVALGGKATSPKIPERKPGIDWRTAALVGAGLGGLLLLFARR